MAKNYKSKVIDVAAKEVGYEEKKTNAYLQFKHKNAGFNNYTKYGKWIGANGDYWCASFLSWIFYKAYGEAEGKKLLCGAYSPACETIRHNFVTKKQYHTTSPKSGDVIFFKGTRHSGANHIGLVTKITSTTVYTVEGNADNTDTDNGGAVVTKTYQRSNARIMGYGRPKYDTREKAFIKMGCRLYKKPSVVSGYYSSIPVGKQITFLSDTGKGWSHVSVKVNDVNKRGYIKNSCIDTKRKLSAYPKKMVTAKTAPVRKSNKKVSKQIATAKQKDIVAVVSEGKFWCNVKYKGKDGFIARKKIGG